MKLDLSRWQECPHRYYQKAYRTFGDNIPYYAQGAVFPGDEAGHRCALSGEMCETEPTRDDCPEYPEDGECS